MISGRVVLGLTLASFGAAVVSTLEAPKTPAPGPELIVGTGFASPRGTGVLPDLDAWKNASIARNLRAAPDLVPLEAGGWQPQEAPYDSHYTFVRIQYDVSGGMRGFGRRGEPDWAHDYPRAERNFLTILAELTDVSPTPGIGRILRMDDPEIFRYPVAYVVEVGSWGPNEEEIRNLGAYLEKGGFLIVDDFRGGQLYQLEAILREALPWASIMEVPHDHEIFDSFFRIEDPMALLPPTFQQYVPVYLGIFEDNDPDKRLIAMFNYNNDIAEYWETSGMGWTLIDLENEAFKFGVNYVIYSMTH